MVHMVRNTLKYVASKDMKAFAADLKTIYNAASENEGQKARDRIVEKWSAKYPNSMKRWIENWDVVVPIFKFTVSVEQLVTGKNTLEANIALFPFSIQRIVNDLLQFDESPYARLLFCYERILQSANRFHCIFSPERGRSNA